MTDPRGTRRGIARATGLGALLLVAVMLLAGLLAVPARPPTLETGASSTGLPAVVSAPSQPAAAQPSGLQLTWTNITSTLPLSPPARQSANMVFDSTDQEVVLFGGELTTVLPTRYYNDTWTFSQGVWTNVTGPVAPSARFGFMMADDPTDHCVVLFGGEGPGPGQTTFNDTWEFQGGVWTNVTTSTAPPARFWGSMSYDSQTGQVILFGGNHGLSPTYSNDTWAFQAGVWTELHPATTPPARDGQNQVDAVSDSAVIMFGGLNASNDLNDTWAYADGNWTALTPATVPDTRTGAGLAYDSAAGAVVMYGGYPANSFYYTTWLFMDGTWTNYSIMPAPPAGTIWGQMTYDPLSDEVLLFEDDGYFNGTWTLNITSSAALTITANASPLSGSVPLTVSFTAVAAGGTAPYSYNWTFGDGSNSSSENPIHQYTKPGNYTANLTVTDAVGDRVPKTWTVNVLVYPLNLAIGATPTSSEVGQNVTFFSTPSGGVPPYTYKWNFGDSTTAATKNVTHAYGSAGTFVVQLTLTDSVGHSLAKELNFTVSNPPNNSAFSLLSGWGLYLLIVLILIVVILVAVLLRRRRKPTEAPPPAEPTEPAATPATEPETGGPPPPPPSGPDPPNPADGPPA